MTQDEKDSLFGEAIGCLMKAYEMNAQGKVLDEKNLDYIEGIIDAYMDLIIKEEQ